MTLWTAPADADRLAIDPILDVWVSGTPQPKGSKSRKGNNLVESADLAGKGPNSRKEPLALKRWTAAIVDAIGPEWPYAPLNESVAVALRFRTHRANGSEYRAWNLYQLTRPDVDKYARAVSDALQFAGVVCEDSRIVDIRAQKRRVHRGQETGCQIQVFAVGEYEQAGWVAEIPDRLFLVRKEAQP